MYMKSLEEFTIAARFRVAALSFLAVALTSCSLVSAPEVNATGTWTGSGTATNGVTQPITFDLTEYKGEGDASVYGTLTVDDITINVSGNRRENRLGLTYTDASSVILIAAMIDGNSMSGDLDIITGGVADAEVTFTVTRQ
jgi:hypothetical protein